MTSHNEEIVLIVPGYQGSGEDHWQSWLQQQLPKSHRVQNIDWHKPVLSHWAAQIRDTIRQAKDDVWVVAHSFGCLASAVAIQDQAPRVRGALYVAPASPERFNVLGVVDSESNSLAADWLSLPRLSKVLPASAPGVPGIIVASQNDPWLSSDEARRMAVTWDFDFFDAGAVGHINTESGHGKWPLILALLSSLQEKMPERENQANSGIFQMRPGRGSALAKVRKETRQAIEQMVKPFNLP